MLRCVPWQAGTARIIRRVGRLFAGRAKEGACGLGYAPLRCAGIPCERGFAVRVRLRFANVRGAVLARLIFVGHFGWRSLVGLCHLDVSEHRRVD